MIFIGGHPFNTVNFIKKHVKNYSSYSVADWKGDKDETEAMLKISGLPSQPILNLTPTPPPPHTHTRTHL